MDSPSQKITSNRYFCTDGCLCSGLMEKNQGRKRVSFHGQSREAMPKQYSLGKRTWSSTKGKGLRGFSITTQRANLHHTISTRLKRLLQATTGANFFYERTK